MRENYDVQHFRLVSRDDRTTSVVVYSRIAKRRCPLTLSARVSATARGSAAYPFVNVKVPTSVLHHRPDIEPENACVAPALST